MTSFPHSPQLLQWTSCQIRKIARCACAGNAGNVFPVTDCEGNRGITIPACITARASRTCRGACRDRYSAVARKTFPAFPAHAQPTILRIWQEAHGTWAVVWVFLCLWCSPERYGFRYRVDISRVYYSFACVVFPLDLSMLYVETSSTVICLIYLSAGVPKVSTCRHRFIRLYGIWPIDPGPYYGAYGWWNIK